MKGFAECEAELEHQLLQWRLMSTDDEVCALVNFYITNWRCLQSDPGLSSAAVQIVVSFLHSAMQSSISAALTSSLW